MRLTELDPVMVDLVPNERGFQRLTFLCPTCKKLRLNHAIWSRPEGEVKWTDADGNKCAERVWQATQGPLLDWDTISLTPSMNTPPHKHGTGGECPGWHGFITNGDIT